MESKNVSGKWRISGIASLIAVIWIMVLAFMFKDKLSEIAAFGYIGLFAACFLANATVLLPAPSTLAVLEFALILHPALVGIIGGLGAATGELTGYVTGFSSQDIFHFNQNRKLFRLFKKYPVIWVVVFSAIPWPVFDVVGIMAGIIKMKPYQFYFACCTGKIIKMVFFAYLSVAVGQNLPETLNSFLFESK